MSTEAVLSFPVASELSQEADQSLFDLHANTVLDVFGHKATLKDLDTMCPVPAEQRTHEARERFTAKLLTQAGVEIPEQYSHYLKHEQPLPPSKQEVKEKPSPSIAPVAIKPNKEVADNLRASPLLPEHSPYEQTIKPIDDQGHHHYQAEKLSAPLPVEAIKNLEEKPAPIASAQSKRLAQSAVTVKPKTIIKKLAVPTSSLSLKRIPVAVQNKSVIIKKVNHIAAAPRSVVMKEKMAEVIPITSVKKEHLAVPETPKPYQETHSVEEEVVVRENVVSESLEFIPVQFGTDVIENTPRLPGAHVPDSPPLLPATDFEASAFYEEEPLTLETEIQELTQQLGLEHHPEELDETIEMNENDAKHVELTPEAHVIKLAAERQVVEAVGVSQETAEQATALLVVLPEIVQTGIKEYIESAEPDAVEKVEAHIILIAKVADSLHVLVENNEGAGEEAKQIEQFLVERYTELLDTLGVTYDEEILTKFIELIRSDAYTIAPEYLVKKEDYDPMHERQLRQDLFGSDQNDVLGRINDTSIQSKLLKFVMHHGLAVAS